MARRRQANAALALASLLVASAAAATSPPFRRVNHEISDPAANPTRPNPLPTDPDSLVDAYCNLLTPLLKVHPQDTILRESSLYSFTIARNEYESVQLICNGGSRGLSNITVSVALNDEAAKAGLSYLLHSQEYYLAVNLSDCNARQGYRPDPLIPEVDPWYGQPRRRTTTIAVSQSAGWWVDFFAGPATPAGTFTGHITVRASQLREPLELGFTIRVRDLQLPDTSPSATSFAFWGFPDASETDMEQAVDLGLMHRVTVSNVLGWADAMSDPPDFGAFMARWGDYLTGKALPFGLGNTTVTSLMMPGGYCSHFANGSCSAANLERTVEFWRAVYDGFDERGLAGLLWDYSIDEPDAHPGAWAELKARHAVVKAVDGRLRTMATGALNAAQANNATHMIDLWVPEINEVAVKGQCYDLPGNLRPSYTNANISVSNLWWYQSCDTHGCDGGCEQIVPSDNGWSSCHMGWPSYMIDHSTVVNRMHPWATWLYNMGGELYWALTFAASAGMDEWESSWWAGGNGDGTLTYRGTPSRIGGTDEIPVASIRLKAIRDGQEDLLYMMAAEAAVGREAVEAVVRTVLTSAHALTQDYSVMAAARERLGDLAEFGQAALLP